MKKEGLNINIKPSKVGSFTKWCTDHGSNGVTNSCISKGKASPSGSIRKKANFAKNARSWK